MILIKAYLDFRYLAIFISYCFMYYCLYGEVEENELIDEFLKNLTAEEPEIIDVVLKSDSSEVFSSQRLLDILEQFNCHLLVNRNNINKVVQELTKKKPYLKAYLMASCRLKLSSSDSLQKP